MSKMPLKKVRKGKSTKEKKVKVPNILKFKVMLKDIGQFFYMVDYPLLITDQMQENF